jgi:hypothetical protein
MFSLQLLTHGRQIAVARLKMFRHREPFVRLVVRRARPPDSKRLPRGLLGEFPPLLICYSLEGWQQASTCHVQAVESGGCEQGARSGDLEAHETLPQPPPRYVADVFQIFNINPRRPESRSCNNNCFLTCQTGGRICSTTAHEKTICRIVSLERRRANRNSGGWSGNVRARVHSSRRQKFLSGQCSCPMSANEGVRNGLVCAMPAWCAACKVCSNGLL